MLCCTCWTRDVTRSSRQARHAQHVKRVVSRHDVTRGTK